MSDWNWTRTSFAWASLEVSRDDDKIVVRDGKWGDNSRTQTWSLARWQELIGALARGEDTLEVISEDDGGVWLGSGDSLYFDANEWNAFIAGVKAGEFEPDGLSTPVPVSEGSQVSGEVGPVAGGPQSNHAATGAGNGGVVPVPVAAQPEPDDKQFVLFDHHLDMDVWYRDDAVATEARASSGSHDGERWFKVGDYDGDPLCWENVLGANPDVVPVLLVRGPLVDHNPETPAGAKPREPVAGSPTAAGVREADPAPLGLGAGSAAPDGLRTQREMDADLYENWVASQETSAPDPFTMSMPLCDNDGIVRRGAMHHGTDYPCTGSAHWAGEHVRCNNRIHDVPGTGSADSDGSRYPAKYGYCAQCGAEPGQSCHYMFGDGTANQEPNSVRPEPHFYRDSPDDDPNWRNLSAYKAPGTGSADPDGGQ